MLFRSTFKQTSFFDGTYEYKNKNEEQISRVEEKVKNINPVEMTPMDAINFLFELKKEVKERK